ncbi:MAG: integrase, partial [Mesorhizobium sp.]
WQEIRQRAKLPAVIPYSLRHSSIVRGIRANLPIRLVAALHDTSVPMIERHYGRWIADGLEDLAAAAVVTLVPAEESNLIELGRR